MDRIDAGGLYAGEPALVGCRGSSWTQTSILLDGLDLSDPERGGTPLFAPDLLALESASLLRDRLPAALPGTGATFLLEPRRPAASWSGSVEAHASGDRLQSEPPGPEPTIARYGSARRLAGLVRGPLSRERLALLIAAAQTRGERIAPRDPMPLAGRDRSLLVGLEATPDDSAHGRLLAGLQQLERPLAGRALYADRDLSERDRRAHLQAAWRRATSQGGWRVAAGYSRAEVLPEVERAPDGVVERLLDGPVPLLVPERSLRQRWQAAARWSGRLGRLGAGPHALELGVGLSHASATTRAAVSMGRVGETLDGRPARIWEYGLPGPPSRRRASELTLDATDRITPHRRVELAAGLRFEVLRGSARDGGRISWLTASPRLATRWLLRERGQLALLAAYGRYRHRLPLSALAFGDPGGAAGATYLWNDANADGRVQNAERGALVSRVGPGGSLAEIDPDLAAPHTDELLLGLEAAPARGLVLRFLAIHREERALLESVNVGVGLASFRVLGVPDPFVDFVGPADDQILPLYDRDPASFGRDRYRLTNPAGHTLLHEAFELFAEKTHGALRLVLGAAAYRSEGKTGWRGFRAAENDQGVIGELFDDPNADSFARGRVFFDRNYVIKLAGAYRAPADLRLAAAVRYQDGQPFARYVLATGLRQGPELVQAVPEGRHRFTYTLTVDIRIEKGFRIGRARLALAAEAFNLFDSRLSVEENPVNSPAFRERPARFVQPPRAIRLGLRLDL